MYLKGKPEGSRLSLLQMTVIWRKARFANVCNRKRNSLVATTVAQTYLDEFIIFNSVSPMWLQGPSGNIFLLSVFVRNSTP